MNNTFQGFILRKMAAGLLGCGLLILGACIPDPLDVSGIPKIKPEIVVSSQIIPDQSLIIFLTKTFGALDASDDSDAETVLNEIAVNDAIVTIEHNGRIDTLLYIDTGVYGGIDFTFETGELYTLRVESPSLGIVTATTEVKPQVPFEEIGGELYFDGFDDTLAQVSYSFNDPIEKNWYMVNVLKVSAEEIQDNLLNPRDFSRLLNDEDFSDARYSETFRVFPREFSRGDTIAVYLSNISEDYYSYMEMRLENRFGLFEFISEPVNYRTNVVGGRGFFNLYVPDIQLVVLE
jgi:hypothetical protein